MVDYNIQEESWYSPIKIIDEFEKLRAHYGDECLKDPVFKRAREMFVGAVALLGAYELSDENKYWQQSNNQTNSPDVVAVKQVIYKGKIHALITQMEIVEMEENAKTDDIFEFLQMTKLSPKKSYTEHDMIVLIINKQVPYDPKDISERLKKLGPKPTIYIQGRKIGAAPGDFIISTPYPTLYPTLDYNVNTTAEKYSIPERIEFGLGVESEIKYTKSEDLKPANTYDALGLNRDRIYKRFGIKSSE